MAGNLTKLAQVVDHAKWPDFWKWQEEHNDDIVWRVRKAVADNLRSRGKWGLLTNDGRIISEDDLNKGQEIPPEVVIRAARAAREARRANCHELADALLRKLQRMRVGAKRVYVDKDRYNGISMGHSTVFFKDKEGRWHRATSGMGRKKNPPFGDFDSLTDAVDQYIAVEKANKQTTDDERVEAFDTTDVPFKNRMPWKDYRTAAMGGERLYTQKAASADTKYSLKENPTYEDVLKVFGKLDFDDRANLVPRHPEFFRKVPDDMLFDRQVAIDGDGNPVGFNEFYYGRNKLGRRQPPHNAIAVVPEARGNGLARLMAEAAVRKARKEKVRRLVWEAFADNDGSIRAALSAGFEDATPKNAKGYRRFVYRVSEKKASSLDLKKLFPNSKFPTKDELKAKEATFSVGDRVKVSDHIRCLQKGRVGTIVRIDPEDKHGWKSFIVKFDDKKCGSMGFSSGNIDKVVEKKASQQMRKSGAAFGRVIAPVARRVMPAMSGVASRVGRIFGRSPKLRPNELVPKDVSNITSRFWNDIVFPMKRRQGTLAKRPNLSDVVIERLPAGKNPGGAVSGRYNFTRDKLFLSSPLPGRSAGNSEFLSGLDTMNHELGHRFTDVLPTPSSTRPQALVAPQNRSLVGDAVLGNFVGEGVPTNEMAATVKELQGRLYADYVSRFNRYPSRRKFMSYLDSLPESRFIDEYGKLNSGYTRPLRESVRLGNELSSLEAKRRQAAELLHSVPQEYVGDVERLLNQIHRRQDAVRAAWYPENMAFTNAGLAKRLVRNMWGFGAAALPSAGMAIGASENGANGLQKRGAAFGRLIAPAARRIAGAFGSAMKNTVRGAKIVGGTARNAWRNGVVDTAKGVWRNGVMGPDGIIGRFRVQDIRPDERVRHFFDDIVIPMKMSSRLNGGVEAYAIKNSPANDLFSMNPASYYHRGFYDRIPIVQRPHLGEGTAGYTTFGPTVVVSASANKPSTIVHELKHVLHKDVEGLLKTPGARMGSTYGERDLLRKVYGIDPETTLSSIGEAAESAMKSERRAFAESAATHAEHQFMVMQELWNRLGRPPTLQEYQDFINKASFDQLRRWRNTVVNGYQSVADMALPIREVPVAGNVEAGTFGRMLRRLGLARAPQTRTEFVRDHSKKALQRYKTALKWVGSGAAMASPLYGTQPQNDGTQPVL